MNLTLVDNNLHLALAPLTLTRPVAELRLGIHTIAKSWEIALSQHFSIEQLGYNTQKYLADKYPQADSSGLQIAGNIKPTAQLARSVAALQPTEELIVNGIWVAKHGSSASKRIELELSAEEFIVIEKPWHLFQNNGKAIKADFELITAGRTSQHLSASNQVIGQGDIFIEEGAKIECAILNASNGPIYIGKDTEVMEGSIIRGPFALCENAVVKMSAKLYGDTTIGPFCKVGGEIANSILIGYSNKGHDGYMGNSLVGEWCNFGADTNTSNLKNNYSNVKVYSYEALSMEKSDVQFCGVIMGDHSKTGINTMLNTATSIGVFANIFGAGFPPKHIPSFSWGGIQSTEKFLLEKAYEVAENVMKRRQIELTSADKTILSHLYKHLA